MLKQLVQTEDDIALLVARLALGVVFFPHGAQLMLGWFGGGGFSATLEGFSGMGMPAVLAFLVISGEFFGSLGLLAGFLSRIAAFGIGCVMLGAIVLVHGKQGFFMNWFGQKQGEGFEFHLLALGLVLAILLKGSGKWSVDRLLAAKA